MAHGSYQDGPALLALKSSIGRPAPLSPEAVVAAERPRDRIWELAETLHCSIVGTCLSTADGRSLLAKLGVAAARTMSEHRLHGEVVHLARRKDGGGKLLQKMLDRRHEREIRRFDRARTVDDVRALWRESLDRGEIPGAYWAAMTHPATDWTLVQDIFGEVHMLSHLVGQSNRADIRRLRQLEVDLAEREERIAAQEARIHELSEQRDTLSARQRASEALQSVTRVTATRPDDTSREAVQSLEARLARECAHAEALEEKLAILTESASRLSHDLAAEMARRKVVEAELSATEAVMTVHNALDETGDAASKPRFVCDLTGRTLLYVGGRPRQVAQLRRFVEARGGTLLSHDGGIEESRTLLPGLVNRSERVFFPVECVSHEATALVKRFCEAGGTPFQPVRSASLASFVHGLYSV